jgi:hypothetical protein
VTGNLSPSPFLPPPPEHWKQKGANFSLMATTVHPARFCRRFLRANGLFAPSIGAVSLCNFYQPLAGTVKETKESLALWCLHSFLSVTSQSVSQWQMPDYNFESEFTSSIVRTRIFNYLRRNLRQSGIVPTETEPGIAVYSSLLPRHNGIASNLFRICLPPTASLFLANLISWKVDLDVLMGP